MARMRCRVRDLANSALVETDVSLDGVNTFFGRAELVQKSAQDLAVADQSESRRYDVERSRSATVARSCASTASRSARRFSER